MSARKSVVYFAYLGDEGTADMVVRDRLAFVDRQLHWLSCLTAAADAPIEVHVPYVAPRAWDGALHDLVAGYGFRTDPASLADARHNRFEYPGFRALKALAARSHPDDLLHYCHSKGVLHLDAHKMGLFRLHTHVALTADLAAMADDPAIDRAGLFPSRYGWCWYNFFWIKAGYMAALPVAEAADRYQFEALIGGPRDPRGHRAVLPLIGRLPFAATGIEAKPWYRAEEASSPAMIDTYNRYARLERPPAAP